MIKVGVIGLGMMGNTHLDVYSKRSDVQVIAVSDANPARLSGEERTGGNIKGQAQGGFDINKVAKYDEGRKLLRNKDIDLIDICLPTPLHAYYAKLVLKAGKHVMLEKPAARTYRDAAKLAAIAGASDKMAMVGMCMRFWPGWTWLKEAVDSNRYGRVLAAQFRRVASHPGGPFYSDGLQCGGAVMDLHIHDTDFIQYVFGMPTSVTSVGYSKITTEPDHVVTRYEYPNIPLVVAEGGWVMQQGFPFTMQYCVNFENATAVFDLAAKDTLSMAQNGAYTGVPLPAGMGYEHEISYFLDCIASGKKPTTVTLESAANSVKIVEAEAKSIKTNRPVRLK